MTTTSQSPKKIISAWHEDPNEQKALLNLLNREGFPLEAAVRKTIARSHHQIAIHAGKVFEGAPHQGGGRLEMDLWIQIGNFVFLIESKRSDFD